MKQLPFIFLLFSLMIQAQDSVKIDSIKRIIPSQKDTMKLKSYGALNRLLLKQDIESSKLYLDSLAQLASELNIEKFNSLSLSRQGYYYNYISDYKKAETFNLEAIKIHRKLDLKEPLYKALNVLGIVQKYLGKLDESMRAHMESLAIKEELGVTGFGLAASYLNIGNLHAELDNFEASDEYYLKASSELEAAGLRYYQGHVLHNLGVNNDDQKRYPKALDYYFQSVEIHKSENHYKDVAKSLNSIGGVYLKQDSLIKAKKYLLESLELSKEYGEKQMVGLTTKNLGNVYYKQGLYSKALAFFKEAQKISMESGTNTRGVDLYRQIAKAYAALSNYKKAYEFRELHFQKYDSIFQEEKIEQINELEVRYQTEKKEAALVLQEKEIQTLNQEVEISNLRKGLYAGGMTSALALFGLSVFGYRQRIKKNRVAREKQEEIYKQEIEYKQKELTSQTLHLVQKNTFIQELMENLENVKNSPDKFKTEFRRIVMLLKKENASDKDWEVFKTYFAEVHNDFDQKLKTLSSEITEKEIRLAAFLRMNLTTKEIAATLNVLPDSILKSKYRLKKKLGLDKETDLSSFLNRL